MGNVIFDRYRDVLFERAEEERRMDLHPDDRSVVMAPELIHRACPVCGTLFRTTVINDLHVCCSIDCAHAWREDYPQWLVWEEP